MKVMILVSNDQGFNTFQTQSVQGYLLSPYTHKSFSAFQIIFKSLFLVLHQFKLTYNMKRILSDKPNI